MPVQEAQASRTATYDIPAQPLAQALTALGQQGGLQIAVSNALVAGKTSAPVSGVMTAEQALQRLLGGTGIVYRFTSANSVVVSAADQSSGNATQLDPVNVQGAFPVPAQAMIGNLPPAYAGGQVATGGQLGLLGNRSAMDTPFSTTSYTSEYLRDNQARTLTDAFADDPTIRTMYPQAGFDDRLFIRGFELSREDIAFNGLYGISSFTSTNLTGIERVEVFRGPSAMLSGMAPNGAVGGVVNVVPKRATDEPITTVMAQYATNAQFGGAFDFGRRFGPGKEVGVRINGSYIGGQTSVARQSDQDMALAMGLDYRGDRTRIDADFRYTNRLTVGIQYATLLNAGVQVPAPPAAGSNYFQPWAFNWTTDIHGMIRLEHDVTPDVTAFLKVGGGRSAGAFLWNAPFVTDSSGAFTNLSNKGALHNDTISAEAGVRARFTTGNARHEAALVGDYLFIRQENAPFVFSSSAVPSNIYAPVLIPSPNVSSSPSYYTPSSQTLLSSIGLTDAISVADDRIQVIGGLRLQRVATSNWAFPTPIQTAGNDKTALSPSVSAIVKPWKEVAFYANFIQALQKGALAGPGLANAGEAFPPFVSTQFEAGVKVDLGNFGATLSAFNITQPSSYTNAATNTLVVNGQQRNRGIEFLVFGEPVPGFRPLGGFTFLDAIQMNTAGGLTDGKFAVGTPTFQANVGVDWTLPFWRPLTLGGRVIYTGQVYLDAENLQPVPAWTRVDLSAKYRFERADGKPISLRANVINVANSNYWTSTAGYLGMGLPRTFMLSLTADF